MSEFPAKSRFLWWTAVAGFVLWMAPLFAGALSALPAADDFVYATRTHQTWVHFRSLPHVLKDAWSYAVQIYQTWQGTLIGAMVMALNPAVFTVAGYFAHAWVLLLAYGAAQYALTRAVCLRIFRLPSRAVWVAFLSMTLLQWGWVPDLLEGLYWYNSAWFYTLAHGVWMLALALALSLPNAHTGRRKLGYALLYTCSIFLGLNNYITAVLALCGLALCVVVYWRNERKRALHLLPAFVLLALGLVASILAPGNAVRLATETQYAKPAPWVLHAAWKTLQQSVTFALRFLLRTPLLAACVVCAPWLFNALRGSARPFARPALVFACAWLLLCAMLFPHIYSAAYAGPSRIVNLYYFYCVTAALFCTAYGMGALARRMPKRCAGVRAKAGCTAFAVALLALALFLSPSTSYRELVGDLFSGDIAAYRAQTLAQFDALAQCAPGCDAVIARGPQSPPSVSYPPFNADPTHWANVAIADYFDLRSVRLDP